MNEIVIRAVQGNREAEISFDDDFTANVPMRNLPCWVCKMLMLSGGTVGISDYPTETDEDTKRKEILECVKHHYEEICCRAGEGLQS